MNAIGDAGGATLHYCCWGKISRVEYANADGRQPPPGRHCLMLGDFAGGFRVLRAAPTRRHFIEEDRL